MSQKKKSPFRKPKGFDLFGNVYKSTHPEYDWSKDPHLSNFSVNRHKTPERIRINAIHRVYKPTQVFLSNNQLTRHVSPNIPRLKPIIMKKIKPVTSDQFKKIILKYRASSTSDNSVNLASDRAFESR